MEDNTPKTKYSLSFKIMIGLISGIVAGLCLQSNHTFASGYIQPFGTFFLNLVKMCIVPLVFSSLVVGVCGMGDIRRMGRIGGKTVAYFLLTTAFAVVLGLIIGSVLGVGQGITLPADLAKAKPAAAPSVIKTLLDIIPANPFDALVKGNMLQVIAFALFIGWGIAVQGEQADTFKKAMEGFANVMYKIIGGIMNLAPYAVFALITPVVAVNGPGVLLPLLGLIIAVYLACILHAALVYSSTVCFIGKTSPLTFFRAVTPAAIFAFTTASSASTLPFSLESSRRLGVPESIRSFILPFGATVNMDGTAAFQGICCLFIAQVYGIDLSTSQLMTIVLTATLASVGTAGVPGAGTVMLGMVLQSVGLPLEGVALIMGVERILDMARTAVNITGDIACSVVVASSENELGETDLTDKTQAV